MSVPQILFYDQSTVTIEDAPGAGAANLLDYQRETTWSAGADTAGQTIIFDMGASVSMSCFVVEGHNWNGIGDIGINLDASSTSDFSGDVVSLVNDGDMTKSGSYATWLPFTKTGRRYWRVEFGATVALLAVPSASLVMWGDPLNFEFYYENDYEVGNKLFDTAVVSALDGSVRTSQPYNGHIVNRVLFEVQSDTVRAKWKTFIETVRGRLYPFYWRDPLEGVLEYMTLSEDYAPAIKTRYNQNKMSLNMRSKYVD